jgi:transketolase
MRNAFIEELLMAAETNEKIVLVVGDLGYGAIEPFAQKFPNRFFNAGVAEQNMMGLAAGLASEGYHVFVYSIANFPTFRCAEQIRNDIDYHNLPVTIVAVGGGLSYGNLGYSHHAVQDYALLRTMPNMLIAAPGDPIEVKACMRYLVNNPQPSYLRLGKVGEKSIHNTIPLVEPGKWLKIKSNSQSNNAYLTTGTALQDLVIFCSNNESDYSIFSMPLWSMKTKPLQSFQLTQFANIVTVEDHLLDGGFGSWNLECNNILPHSNTRIKIKGLSSEVCGMVAKQIVLNEVGGLKNLIPSMDLDLNSGQDNTWLK